MTKHLLIVFHSQSGNASEMTEAVLRGATHPDIQGVEVKTVPALRAGVRDLLWAHALILGTPENFGYMSGGLKVFFDRTFYPAQGRVEGLPYAMYIKGGNDGTGAASSIRRIAAGYPFKEVQEPIICGGDITDEILARCEELGTAMAAGLELGMF